MELDIDYQLVSDVADAGGMYITDKFFVHMGSFYIDIIPISEIVFVYKHSQRIGMPGAHFKLTYTVHILGKKRFKCSCFLTGVFFPGINTGKLSIYNDHCSLYSDLRSLTVNTVFFMIMSPLENRFCANKKADFNKRLSNAKPHGKNLLLLW